MRNIRLARTVLWSLMSERQVYGVKEFSVATIASNGAAGGAAGALKVSMHSSLFGACRGETTLEATAVHAVSYHSIFKSNDLLDGR